MRGPDLLSLVLHDQVNCASAYPDSGTLALVFDLATGAPVNWMRLHAADMARYPASLRAAKVTRHIALCTEAVRGDTSFQLWPDAAAHALAPSPPACPAWLRPAKSRCCRRSPRSLHWGWTKACGGRSPARDEAGTQGEISSSERPRVAGPKAPIVTMTTAIERAMNTATPMVPPCWRKKPMRRPAKAAEIRLQE